jgi:hypothetical protein
MSELETRFLDTATAVKCDLDIAINAITEQIRYREDAEQEDIDNLNELKNAVHMFLHKYDDQTMEEKFANQTAPQAQGENHG